MAVCLQKEGQHTGQQMTTRTSNRASTCQMHVHMLAWPSSLAQLKILSGMLQDIFVTPLALGKALRRVSADSASHAQPSSSQPQIRKALSHREGTSIREGAARSPSGTPRTPFTPAAIGPLGQQQLHRKQSFLSTIK